MYRQLETFAQLLVVQLANVPVPDSPTTKTETPTISEMQILACFAKIVPIKITNHMVLDPLVDVPNISPYLNVTTHQAHTECTTHRITTAIPLIMSSLKEPSATFSAAS